MVVWMLGLIWLTGCLLLSATSAVGNKGRVQLADVPLAFGAGAVWLHITFLLASWNGTVPVLVFGVAPTVFAVLVLWRWCRGRIRPGSHGDEPCMSLICWCGLAALLLLQVVMVLKLAELPLFDWEGRMLWALKAKFLTDNFTVLSEPFTDPYRLHIHPRYPLLVPWLTALLSRTGPVFKETCYYLVVMSFALLTTWQIYQRFAWKGKVWMALTGGGVLILSSVWFTAEINAQVEIVLSFYLVAGLDRLLQWQDSHKHRDLMLAAVMFAGAAMTKNEGFLMLLCASIGLGIAGWPPGSLRRNIKAGGLLLTWAGMLLLPWILLLARLPVVSDENYLHRMNMEALREGLKRVPQIVQTFAAQMADWELWHMFWLLIPLLVVMVLLRWRRSEPGPRLIALVWVGYFCGILLIYIVSPWSDVALHIDNSFDRVLLPLFPCGLMLLGMSMQVSSDSEID